MIFEAFCAFCGLSSFLSAGASFTSRECEFASARHRVNGTRDLRIGVVEDLRRNSIAIGCRQHVVAQLSFRKGTRFIELLGSGFEIRLGRGEFLQLFKDRIGNRIVFVDELVIEFDRISKSGVFGKPALATAEKGRQILEITVSMLRQLVIDTWPDAPGASSGGGR